MANADYVRVVAGPEAIVAPLKNDQDPLGGELRLASVDKPATGSVSAIADNGTFTFASDTAGRQLPDLPGHQRPAKRHGADPH